MIIGIDYGFKWCGLATSEGELATPLEIIRTSTVIERVKKLAPSLVVVGVSEGQQAVKTKEFINELIAMTGFKVQIADETLTSIDAQRIKKVGKKDHNLAAALILERWLVDNK